MVGAGSPVASVLVLRDGPLLRRLPIEIDRPDVAAAIWNSRRRSGAGSSSGTLSALALGVRFPAASPQRCGWRTAAELRPALVRGTREPLRSPFEPRRQPLLLTTLARHGLSRPGAHAVPPTRKSSRTARSSTSRASRRTGSGSSGRSRDPGASYRRQLAPTGTIDGGWWLGEQTPLPRPNRDPALDPWLDATAIGELAGVAQQRIDRLYTEVAAAAARPDAPFFVEKYRPDAVPELMLELYPGAREVMLVRDFRDMIASMFAYNEKRGRQGFRRDRATSDHDYIVNYVGVPRIPALAGAWARRSDTRPPAPLRGPRPTTRSTQPVALLEYLELEASPVAGGALFLVSLPARGLQGSCATTARRNGRKSPSVAGSSAARGPDERFRATL